jgi:uncharacterized protein YggT (Ycf19 family)
MAKVIKGRHEQFHEAVPAADETSYRSQPVAEADRSGKVIYVLTLALEVLLGLRLILRLLGASAKSSFAAVVYNLSEPFIRPFVGIFNTSIDDQIAGIELATLFAMLIYGLLGYLIIAAIRAIQGRKV